MSPAPSGSPTRKWLVSWSIVATATLVFTLFGLRARIEPIAITGGLSVFGVGLFLGNNNGPWTRLMPAIVAIAIAGLGTLYRVLAYQDWRLGWLFLNIGGVFVAAVILLSVHTRMTERGIVVLSPTRRWLSLGLMLALVLKNSFHFESEFVTYSLLSLWFVTNYWPSRWSRVLFLVRRSTR
jgi:hypothetical protein